jgi:hypothetical protein
MIGGAITAIQAEVLADSGHPASFEAVAIVPTAIPVNSALNTNPTGGADPKMKYSTPRI